MKVIAWRELIHSAAPHPLVTYSLTLKPAEESPMALLVLAALIVTTVVAITWVTTTAALRQFQQEQVATEKAGPESGWSITPAHLRMW